MGQQDKQKLSNLTKSQASIYSIKKKKKEQMIWVIEVK